MIYINNTLFINPTPVPAHILGSVNYYEFRYHDFLNRFPGENPPQYYMQYGDKYIKKFTTVLYNKLTEVGKLWIDKTTWALQIEIEHTSSNNPKIGLRVNEFKNFIF